MRVRTYGLLLLVLVGVAPISVYGVSALTRAHTTSAQQVREGNRRAARAIAGRIAAYVASERQLVAAIGIAVWHARDAHARQLVLDAYQIGYRQLHDMAVYDAAGRIIAGRAPEERSARYQRFATRALAGERVQSNVEAATESGDLFAHTMTIGEPVEVAGERVGAIVARYDLVGIWPAVDSVRVGVTGVVRLLAHDGRLLAHGDPEERRYVFDGEVETDRAVVASALLGRNAMNRQGDEIVPAVAFVPGFPGIVVVEQAVLEAFADIEIMQRNLVLLAAAALAFAVALGLAFGRRLVRALEAMRAHTRALAGDLQRKLALRTRLVEVRELSEALDDMAEELFDERERARARERLATFARVAAGLAHDLRMPIEAVRSAVELSVQRPEDPTVKRLLEKIRQRDLPRLKRFVDDLHRLAHRGNLGLEYTRVDLDALLDDIRSELAAAPKWYGVSFEVRGAARPAMLDRGLVRRAVINLASNGAEACLELSPGGTVTLEIEDVDAGGAIEIRIIDTGIGLPPDRVSALENSDFQSTKRTSGVGLGLGVVRQVLAAHGGELIISSQVGIGSVFVMRLPRMPARDTLHKHPASAGLPA